MATDEQGNLKPLMLSDLVRIATQAFKEHGDMPVGVETCVARYEYNEEHSLPVSDTPTVGHPRWMGSYWIGKFKKAFVIDGA